MKYLKKFNEELRPQTYRNAAKKLLKQSPFNKERAEDLNKWADKREMTEDSATWEKMKAETSKFGTYELHISNPSGDFVGKFHPYITFERDGFLDEYEDNKEHGEINSEDFDMPLSFFLGSVPADQETLDKCLENMPEPDFGNGFFWTNNIGILVYFENGSTKINDIMIDEYDDSLTGTVSIKDRKSAQLLKTLLVKMFSEPNLGYPSGYNDFSSFYEMFEAKILAEAGLSSDFGFSMEAIADFLKAVSANKFIG